MPVAKVLRELGELVFPPRCQICDRFCRTPICEQCAVAFERIEPPLCESCGCPFDPHSQAPPVCGECARERRMLARARSFGLHVGRLRDAVNALKFRGRLRLAEPLGQYLGLLLGRESPMALSLEQPPDGLVPVPLHPRRRRERGFDQAERLAAALSQASGVPQRSGLLVRTRYTTPQIGLNPRERRENVQGAFELCYPLPGEGLSVLLVDDVYTTGSTLEECARTLRKGGAGAVYAVTVTRAAPEWHPAADLDDGR